MPLLNGFLTDCVFEVPRATSVEEVNALLKAAADGPLKGILGYKRELRWQRVKNHWQVLRSGLRPAGY